MAKLQRQVMKFLIPISVEAVGTNDLTARSIVPFYLNPQSVDFSESKLVQKTLTKGGYVIQYWGEDLPRIQIAGTTGSGGIEAINILRDVYRHEQLQFSRDIIDRARQFAQEARSAILETSTSTAEAGLSAVIDSVLDGGFQNLTDGISTAVASLSSIFFDNEELRRDISIPITLSAYAVSIDIFYQGVKYRGYFNDFQFSESAERAGHFNYTFNFTVTKITGKRKNFMPWHKNPYDASGQPRQSSIPTASGDAQELTFVNEFSSETQDRLIGNRRVTSTFVTTQEDDDPDPNQVGINRFGNLT